MLRQLDIEEMKMVGGGQIGDGDDGSKYWYDTPMSPFDGMPDGGTGSFNHLFGGINGGLIVPDGFVLRDRNGAIIPPDRQDENNRGIYDGNDNPATNSEVPGVPDHVEGGTITGPDGYEYEIPQVFPCC